MRLDQCRCRDLPAATGWGHVNDNAKIQMVVVEAERPSVRRFAQNRKDADDASGRSSPTPDGLRPKGATMMARKRKKCLQPARSAREQLLRGPSRIEASVLDGHAIRVGKLRAGEQRGTIDLRLDFLDIHFSRSVFSPAAGNARPGAWHRHRCRTRARPRRRARRVSCGRRARRPSRSRCPNS